MPSSCAVLTCVDKYCQSKEVSYHKFPTNPQLLLQWCEFTGRPAGWRPSRWSSICSRHFDKQCFRQHFLKRVLNTDAVPSSTASSDVGATGSGNQTKESQQENVELRSIPEAAAFDYEPDTPYEYDESEEPLPSLEQIVETLCRLCGGTFTTKQLVCYSSFFNLIIKCFPTLNLETYEYFPRQICVDCREKLINFSIFIDKTMSAQKYLINRLVYNLPNLDNSFNNKQILPRIKQEPIVTIKEESHDRLKPIVHGLKDRLSFKEPKSTSRISVTPSLRITSVDDDIQILDPAPLKVEEIIEGEDEELPAASTQQTAATIETDKEAEHNYSKPYYPGKIEILEERVFKSEPFWTEPQVCDICSDSFDSSRLLEFHKASVHPPPVRVCSDCSVAFWSLQEYLIHKIQKHKYRRMRPKRPCPYCKRKFAKDKIRRNHTKNCSLKHNLQCPSCELMVATITEMINHECLPGVESTKTETPSSVTVDDVTIQAEEIIIMTEDGHILGKPPPPTNLPMPMDVTVTKRSITIDKKLHQTVDENSKKLNQTFKCSDCGLKFTTSHLRTAHQKHHRPPSEWNSQCIHCCRLFDTRNDLEQHSKNDCPSLKRSAFISQARTYVCLICRAKFSSQYSLKMHENIHTRSVQYPCEYCGKIFLSKQNLHQHLTTHSVKRTHKCHLCSKAFKWASG